MSPEVLAAVVAANADSAMPYGDDAISQGLTAQFSELFERDVVVFPVATGSAANALALAALTPPYGAIYCHTEAHIYVDECGAPEFYTGGAKLATLPGQHGKLTAADLAIALRSSGAGVVHHVQPAAISITQATEAGTVYTIDEVGAIAQVAQEHHLALHMDGARFANAIVGLGCRPADITWRAGVDVLSFGATKNGAMAAEAVIFFNPDQAQGFEFRRKRSGHLLSKMRFLSAQLSAYITHDLWLHNATHANRIAKQLATGLAAIPGVKFCHPVQANEMFLTLPQAIIDGLTQEGFQFYQWTGDENCSAGIMVRLVTAFNTSPEDVTHFVSAARRYATLTAPEADPAGVAI